MEYQVSALKWRPQSFEDLVGQETIIQTLSNAIRLNRVAHAYLFSGTRGVGKTTTARILAKALNCETGPTAKPCGKCDFCVEIRQGNCVDVLEIDGASNNGVAEVRDLIDRVQYAASACRYKIYIIDEIHMLSKSAFNALLKTLEEPPRRVVFIFATTELIKIPETILSRCQCFEFKSLTQKQIIEQMRLICQQEKITIDNLGLERVAKNAAGSMRDSQSLLDQVVAFCGKEIKTESVESILGIVARDALETFINHLIERDSPALISLVQEIASTGKDLNYFCRDLIEYLRDLLLTKIAKKPETLLSDQTCNLTVLKQQAEKFHVDELHQMFSVLSQTESQMKRSSMPQTLLEMAVLRLADVRPFRDIGKMIEQISQLESDLAQNKTSYGNTIARPATPQVAEQPVTLSATRTLASHAGNTSAEKPPLTLSAGKPPLTPPAGKPWENIKAEICAKKPYFSHYLDTCQPEFPDSATIRLCFCDSFTMELVKKEENLEIIREAVQSVYKTKMDVELVLQNSKNSVNQSSQSSIKGEKISRTDYNKLGDQPEIEILREAMDIFGGNVIR